MITITINGSSQKLIAAVGGADSAVLQGMRIGLARALQFAVGQAGSTYMSGPTKSMLGVRSGRLRGSLTAEVEAGGETVLGRIGSNMPYAAIWEFGFHGEVDVAAHTRVNGWVGKSGRALKTYQEKKQFGNGGKKGGIVLGVFRKDIRPAHVRAGLSNFQSLVQVRASRRRIDQNPRPYLLPALEATDIGGEIGKAIKEQT